MGTNNEDNLGTLTPEQIANARKDTAEAVFLMHDVLSYLKRECGPKVDLAVLVISMCAAAMKQIANQNGITDEDLAECQKWAEKNIKAVVRKKEEIAQ